MRWHGIFQLPSAGVEEKEAVSAGPTPWASRVGDQHRLILVHGDLTHFDC